MPDLMIPTGPNGPKPLPVQPSPAQVEAQTKDKIRLKSWTYLGIGLLFLVSLGLVLENVIELFSTLHWKVGEKLIVDKLAELALEVISPLLISIVGATLAALGRERKGGLRGWIRTPKGDKNVA